MHIERREGRKAVDGFSQHASPIRHHFIWSKASGKGCNTLNDFAFHFFPRGPNPVSQTHTFPVPLIMIEGVD